jgi:drug/metabolite transporter (DMT)-like permease
LVSAAAFGALGVLARAAYDDGAEPIAVLMCRFVIAAFCFLILRAFMSRPRPPASVMRGLVVMGVGYLTQSLCYFTAITHAPPGLVALMLYTYPVLVVSLGAVFLGLRLTRKATIACAVAVAGTALIVGPSARSGDPLGVAFGLGAAGVYAIYILIGSRVLQHVDALTASAVIMTTAAIGFVAVFAISPDRPSLPESASGWSAILAIGLVCTVVAGISFLAGLARVGPADASTLSTVEPVVSVVLSAIVVGESITAWTVVGGAMVLGSVIVLSRSSSQPLAEAAPVA